MSRVSVLKMINFLDFGSGQGGGRLPGLVTFKSITAIIGFSGSGA